MYLRHMVISNDLASIMEIEKSSEETFWNKTDFKELVRIENNISGKVIEIADEIVGYMVYQLDIEQIDLLNLTIKPKFRKMGYASVFLDQLKKKINPVRTSIRVEVRESNLPAQLLLKKNGFICTDILPFWFEDSYSDASFEEDDDYCDLDKLESGYLFYYRINDIRNMSKKQTN